MTNRQNKWIKRKIEQLRKNTKCSFCGSTEFIEFAHIEETALSGEGRGRKERYYDIIRNPDKYIPLCKQCHLVFDHEGNK